MYTDGIILLSIEYNLNKVCNLKLDIFSQVILKALDM